MHAPRPCWLSNLHFPTANCQPTQAEIFGSSFSLEVAGCDDFPPDLLVPGVVVFSRRALPLAAWTNGLEIACVRADVARSCLILETGVNQRWKYGSWK